jgi:2-polyprenyl-3-methyl-5-hydroxy-6-metoxy-1,4-benzoquinol methylase
MRRLESPSFSLSCRLCRGRFARRKYRLRGPNRIPFAAAECSTCGLFQVDDDWSAHGPLRLTTDADQVLADPLWGSDREIAANKSKAIAFAQRLADERLLEQCRVVEIGCGRGLFLRECRDRGAALVTGQEFRNSDIAYARDVLALQDIRPIEMERVDVWPDHEFDLACSFDVLEHVHDLKTFFEQCFRVVRPGGYVFHATPGYDSISHRLGRFLAHYDRTERTMLMTGVLCNLDPEVPEQGGGHVSIIGIRQLKWLEKEYLMKLRSADYVASYSYSNEHYATLIPYLRKLPTPLGSAIFRLARSTVRNKLVFLAQVPN